MTEAVTQCSYCSQSAGDDVAAFHEVHIQPATKPKLDGMVKEILKEAAKHTRQHMQGDIWNSVCPFEISM